MNVELKERETEQKVKPTRKLENAAVIIESDYIFTCSCGNIQKGNYRFIHQTNCGGCGTRNVHKVAKLNQKRRVNVGYELTAKEKDDRSFHLVKDEIVMMIDEDYKGTLKIQITFELKYNLKDKQLQVFRNGKESKDPERFFRGLDETRFIGTASTPVSKHYYDAAIKYYGKTHGEKSVKIGRALERIAEHPALELFAFAGYGHLLYDIHSINHWRNSTKTKPHEVLGVPKYMMKYIKKLSRLSAWTIRTWNEFDEELGGTNFKIILDIIEDESDLENVATIGANYMELVRKYGYTNHKQLTTYLARDIKLQQGITSMRTGVDLLRDYVRMCREMKVEPNKYSRNLKKDHDVTAMNYSVIQDELKTHNFKRVMEGKTWDDILYKDKEYTVIKPTEPADLVQEGDALGHCVKSYVDDVIRERCKILFIRNVELEEISLLTVEVRGNTEEGFRIVQVRGRGNRSATTKEQAFISKWAAEKGLTSMY